MSIFSRLVLGYLALLLLATGVSVYAIMNLGLVKNVTHSIIAVDDRLADLNKKLTDALLSESGYEKKYLIVQNADLYESAAQARQDFTQYLNEALVITDSAETKNLLISVKERHGQCQDLFAQEVEFLRNGKSYPKSRFRKEKDACEEGIFNDLKTLKALGQKKIFEKIRDLREAGTRARTVALTITAVSMVFGIMLSVFITRSITAPLSVMKRKTREIAGGNFESDLVLPSPPEVGELAAAINVMCSRLKEADKMKTDFFSLMSHELRTPLTSIKEGTSLFLEGHGGPVTEKQKKLLSIVAEESSRLIGLVNSLLDLSKMEAGMLKYTFEKSDLAALIRKVVKEILPLAESRRIRVHTNVSELRPVRMDSERIMQAMRNLIGNAVKFTPDGGEVTVSAKELKGYAEFSVTDSGPGIPSQLTQVIFDKFQQATVSGSARTRGTGLGLAIVKHIIDKHGGRIWIESPEGKGCTFFFALPL